MSLDGANMQVTWEVSGDGCHTTASRNSEHNIYVPQYPARRRAELLSPAVYDRVREGSVPQRFDMNDEAK